MEIKKICIHCMREKNQIGGVCPYCGNENESYKPEPHYLPPMTPLNGKYLIGKVLGQGGFGITYLALDTHLQVPVAIKELYLKNLNHRHTGNTVSIGNQDQPVFEENRKRLLQEARVLAMFNESDSEGIVTVKDHFEENGTAYIVMEYLDGVTLKQHVRQQGKLSYDHTLAIIESVGHALTKIHKFGVIHKDVGPDNIMVVKGNKVKLLDFGGATNMFQKNSEDIISFKRGYAPPEQYHESGKIAPWTDVYALAATMYFCLTGTKPVDAMERNAGTMLPALSKYDVKLNAKIEETIMTALQLQPSKRFASVEDFINALHAQDRKPKPVLWAAVGLGAAAIVAGAFLLNGPKAPENNPTPPETTTAIVETAPQLPIGETIPVTLGTYIVENYADPNMIMGIDSGFCDNGAHLVLKEYAELNRNRVMVTNHVEDDGFYNLQIAHTNSFLLTNETQELGAEMIQNSKMLECGTEKWVFVYCGEENGRKVFILKNAAGSVIAPKDGNLSAGNDLVLAELDMNDPTQKWYLKWNAKDNQEGSITVLRFGDVLTDLNGVYSFTSTMDGNTTCSISSNEELLERELIVWKNVNGVSQQFRLEPADGIGCYRIYPLAQPEGEQKCLEYDAASGKILLRDRNDVPEEVFQIVYSGYNTYLIKTSSGGFLGFEVREDGTVDGSLVIVVPYDEFEHTNQLKWMMHKVEGSN